ncbi:DUF982 domain-containing protein [Georhizobium profundi]|jgi:hypothetical protein|uniref:DUF982 domain-containing protein n=1 Tax=Georhizobium profundi TaxID=2341112 RepID=A0A3S9B8E6_9HYPH|nr:DUF982 domain-containing protein [Georhizobium profundi]AZN73210.1 DUF982 domain-containing protein [Georhizobium profundi]
MSARPFSPVWVTLPGRPPRRVDSAFEALECLMGGWPITTHSTYRRAVQACRDAIDGFVPATKAREAFLAAARTIGATTSTKPAKHHDIAAAARASKGAFDGIVQL